MLKFAPLILKISDMLQYKQLASHCAQVFQKKKKLFYLNYQQLLTKSTQLLKHSRFFEIIYRKGYQRHSNHLPLRI